MNRPISETDACEQDQLKGLVFDIERFCVHDGPGIRSVVFLKGCPLSCPWCANPEGLRPKAQVVFYPEKCIGCGDCQEACVHGAIEHTSGGEMTVASNRCVHCAECVLVCDAHARILYGKEMTVHAVFEEISKDTPFYRRSQGGVTLSGGEPLMQVEFTHHLLRYCSRRHIHTAIETSGNAPWKSLSRALEFANLVLFDFKHLNPLKHLRFTGTANQQILQNLRRLDTERTALVIRIPVIPGFNATFEEMQSMATFIASLDFPHECHLLPYHTFAKSKYMHFGIEGRFHLVESPNPELMEEFREIWLSRGLNTQIGG